MEWLIVLMVAVPVLVLTGGTAWYLAGEAGRRRLLAGDPEARRLAERAQSVAGRLASGPGVAGLPEGLRREVLQEARELVEKVLPGLLEQRRGLAGRLASRDRASLGKEVAGFEARLASSADPETRALAERNLALARERLEYTRQLEAEHDRTLLCLQALVGNLEAMDDRLAAGITTEPGQLQLEGATRLLDELKQVQTEYRKLTEETRLLSE